MCNTSGKTRTHTHEMVTNLHTMSTWLSSRVGWQEGGGEPSGPVRALRQLHQTPH